MIEEKRMSVLKRQENTQEEALLFRQKDGWNEFSNST